MRVLLNLLTTLNRLLIYFTWKKLDKKRIFMSKYFMKTNEKSARSHPQLRKNASRLLAPTTTSQRTTAVSKSPFRTS